MEEEDDSEFGDFIQLDLDEETNGFKNPVHELISNLSQLIPEIVTDVTVHVYQRKRTKTLATQLQEQPKRHRICVPVDAPSTVFVLPTISIEEALRDVDTSIFFQDDNKD